MHLSQKCQYALRAVFELCRRQGQGPIKIADVAKAQAIPVRFLEQILSQLRQGGFVESRRGNGGGYLLTRCPREITLGEVIRFIEGPIEPVECMSSSGPDQCPLRSACVFMPIWHKAQEALATVYDDSSFQGLIDEDKRMRGQQALTYAI